MSEPNVNSDRPAGDPLAGWGSLFQQSTDAVFLLNRRRRLRFVNAACERLVGQKSEAILGLFCLPRSKGAPALQNLAQTLAPPASVLAGAVESTRRSVPPARTGPPWWDITFFPLRDGAGLSGIIGRIVPIAEDSAKAHASSKGFVEGLIAERARTAASYDFDWLASATPIMHRVVERAQAASRSLVPLWISGEAGTGKETLARIVHFRGLTAEKSFLKMDCRALQPALMRNMLFGQNGLAESPRLGTLFVKNPSAMLPELQSELLDWYSERADAPRVIVAAGPDAEGDMRAGSVVPEFWSTFGVMEIVLPPLRDRMVDFTRVIARIGDRVQSPFPGLAPAAMDLLLSGTWPGNFRQLREVLRVALERSEGKRIEVAHFPNSFRESIRIAKGLPPRPNEGKRTLDLPSLLQKVEKNLLEIALKKARGNKAEAAELLGLNRTQLWRRLKDHGMETE